MKSNEIIMSRTLKEFQCQGTLVRAFYYTAVIEDQEFSGFLVDVEWLDGDALARIVELAKAGLPAEIEVYTGAAHGWCPPDSGVYNEPQAEKAWSRLLALYGKALA